jgi:hypothetical protein
LTEATLEKLGGQRPTGATGKLFKGLVANGDMTVSAVIVIFGVLMNCHSYSPG